MEGRTGVWGGADRQLRGQTGGPPRSPALTCDAVDQHLPLVQLLLQLPDLPLLAPVSHGQLWEKGRRELGRVGGTCPLPGGPWVSPHPFRLPRWEQAGLTVLQHLVPHIPAEEKRQDETVPPHVPPARPLSPPQSPRTLTSACCRQACPQHPKSSALGPPWAAAALEGAGGEGVRELRAAGDRGHKGQGTLQSLTGLVVQQVVLLHELPVELQGLGRAGRVEDIRVLVEQFLEGVERGLAGLQGDRRDTCHQGSLRHQTGAPPPCSAPGQLLPIPPWSAAAPRLC